MLDAFAQLHDLTEARAAALAAEEVLFELGLASTLGTGLAITRELAGWIAGIRNADLPDGVRPPERPDPALG